MDEGIELVSRTGVAPAFASTTNRSAEFCGSVC